VAAEIAGEIRSLDAAGRREADKTYQDLSSKGLRVLAVAWRDVPERPAYGPTDEAGLTLAGFAAFEDPVLADAPALLETLRRDGVEVKILTGDNELVARRICSDVGLDRDPVVLGADVDGMTDAALGAVAERTSVFARVSPSQKTRILLALKRRGHVVGFLGDGVNDAPSLHAADVGISVSTAVEIAREAAEVILLERSLRVLHEGILAGRRSFGNVMKYLLMGTSSNFGNMFSMAAASLFLPFLPMLPTQILLNNLLYDVSELTIPMDRVDDADLARPRAWDMDFVRRFMWVVGPVSSLFDFLTFFLLLKVFDAGRALFQTGWFIESLATQVLVIFVIRTRGNPLESRPAAALVATSLTVVAVAVALPFTALAPHLGFVAPPALFFALLAGMVLTYLLLVECVKRAFYRRWAS
jgi:Mg2+-importing ATPase